MAKVPLVVTAEWLSYTHLRKKYKQANLSQDYSLYLKSYSSNIYTFIEVCISIENNHLKGHSTP